MKSLWIAGTSRLNIYQDRNKHTNIHTYIHSKVTEWMHSDRRHVGQPRKRWTRPTAIKMEQA